MPPRRLVSFFKGNVRISVTVYASTDDVARKYALDRLAEIGIDAIVWPFEVEVG